MPRLPLDREVGIVIAIAVALFAAVTVDATGCSRDVQQAAESSPSAPAVSEYDTPSNWVKRGVEATVASDFSARKQQVDIAASVRERLPREGVEDPFQITDVVNKYVDRLLNRYKPQTELEKAVVLYRSIIPSSSSFELDGRQYRGYAKTGGGLQIPFNDESAAPLRKKHGSLLPGEIIQAPAGQRVANCLEYSFLLIALLRAAGIEAQFGERPDHAYVVSVLDQKRYGLDPANLVFRKSERRGERDLMGVAVHYSNEGVINKEQSRLGEAIRCFDVAIALRPGFAEAFVNKGLALRRQGKLQEAIQAYNRALAINPRDARAWSNKGVALAGQGKLERAMACYDRALGFRPVYHKPWNNKGIVLFRKGKLDKAIECYDRALAIKPDYIKAWYNRGLAMRARGDLEEAIRCFERALQTKPDKAAAWFSKGVALEKQGKPQEAKRCFDKAEILGFTAAGE